MDKVKDKNYVVIQGWMVNKLKLKGNELLVYALIYGFSQSENQKYAGSLQYLADWTNSTKQGVLKNLKLLVEKGFIQKEERMINGIKFCEYYATEFNGVLNKVEWGIKQSLTGGIKQSLTNNIDINNIEDNKDIYMSDDVIEQMTINDQKKIWFAEFWKEYPKKVGKADAEKKFNSKCKSEKTFMEIMDGLNKQNQTVFSKREMKYIPNPSTWLNQERWSDEYEDQLSREEQGWAF